MNKEIGPSNSLGLLVGAEDPLGGYFVRELMKFPHVNLQLIVDEKKPSAKDLTIFLERVGEYLPPLYAENVISDNKVFFVTSHNHEATIDLIKKKNVTLLANIGTPRILSKAMIDQVPTILNCHPGLLPNYRGCTAVEWALYNKEPVGNTVHIMDSGIDTGPIIIKTLTTIEPYDSYQQIRVKNYKSGFSLMALAAHLILDGKLRVDNLVPQGIGKYWKPIDGERLAEVKKLYHEKVI